MTPVSSKLNKIDEFICFLAKDENWHNLAEVAEAIKLPEEKVKGIAQTFAEAKFATYNEKTRTVKIVPKLRGLYIALEKETKRASSHSSKG